MFISKIIAAIGCAYMMNGGGHDANIDKRRASIVHWLVAVGLFPSKAAAGIAGSTDGGASYNQDWQHVSTASARKLGSSSVSGSHSIEQTALMLFVVPELLLSAANFASSYVTRVGVRANFMRIV